AAGSAQIAHSPGSIFRGIRDGFSIKGGILSSLMAKAVLPGTKDSLEGKAGLFNLYFRGAYEPSYLTDGLGKCFENTGVSFKVWPSCRLTHESLDATLGILREHDIRPGDIEEISVSVGERQAPRVESLVEARRCPQTIIDAKFSIPFTLGVAVTYGKVLIQHFSPEGLKTLDVLRVADKVTFRVDPGLKYTLYSTIVEIKTKGGKRYSKRVDFPYGHPEKPIAEADLVAKFKDCIAYSAKPLSRGDVEAVIDMVDRLEEVEDVSRIIRMLG
ncbi:MmgE/PrpD family protein, partial [Chloroflexota bacterium]